MIKYAAFAVLVAMIGLTEAKMQNVTIKGIAVCNKHTMANVKVELWEHDTMDPNDLLAETHTNTNGEFFITGGDNEITSIAPYLKIRHNCKVTGKPDKTCYRKTEYPINKEHIFYADEAPKVYDMTYVTLDIFVKDEKEICDMLKYTVFALLVTTIVFTEAKMQNVTVQGFSVCAKRRLADVKVELWKADNTDPSGLLAETHTDFDGHFILTGGDDEMTNAPYLKFHHNCKVAAKPDQTCHRNTEYPVPKSFIYPADLSREIYDMTYVNLDIFLKDNEEICEKKKN